MGKLNTEKLSVEFRQGVTPTEPVKGRAYTLTHSDITAELFLTIGEEFAYDKITPMRDEVLGKWVKKDGQYFYYVNLHVSGDDFGLAVSIIRNKVFIRELPLALEAIRYGDSEFFKAHPELDNVPIAVHFKSDIPRLNRVENWGSFSDYVI